MNSTVLLKKLLAIEQAIGTATNITIRDLVHEAQACLLEMQRENAERFLAQTWRDTTQQADWLRKAS
ncbi:MAG: hypothetical protein WBC92_12420 [Terracidiphilus sp.]